MRDPKHPRQFTEEFRRQIVALVDSGKPRAEVMRECDLEFTPISLTPSTPPKRPPAHASPRTPRG